MGGADDEVLADDSHFTGRGVVVDDMCAGDDDVELAELRPALWPVDKGANLAFDLLCGL